MIRPDCVAFGWPPQRTVQYACGGLRGTRLRVTRLVRPALAPLRNDLM